ncbi:MAG: adenosylcobinamide-GDP ribazoletransferase [Cellulosilyticaceae bacterium]
MKSVQHFVLGMQFLTRIPLTKKAVPCEPKDFKGAMGFFTTIGFIVGLIQYGAYVVGAWLVNPLIGALCATVAGIWTTGGLHLDGLADVFDGFGANQSKERTLEIMKDSRVGSFGALALILDFAIHFIAIYSLSVQPLLIIWIPVAGKASVCLLCFIGKNIKEGMGALWIQNIGGVRLSINLLFAFVLGAMLSNSLVALGGMIVIVSVTWWVNRLFVQKLGGLNGDALGAMQQLMEWAMLLYTLIVAYKWQ